MVQARYLCWSMSVKSTIARCLSNGFVKVSRNSWERTLNIEVIKHFWNDTFEKKFTIAAMEVFLIHLFSLTLVFKQKVKMKTLALSYHSKVTSAQNKGALVYSWSEVFISMFGSSQSFPNNSNLIISNLAWKR